jgi:hypothetical protein
MTRFVLEPDTDVGLLESDDFLGMMFHVEHMHTEEGDIAGKSLPCINFHLRNGFKATFAGGNGGIPRRSWLRGRRLPGVRG